MPIGKYTRKIIPVKDRLLSKRSIQPNGCWHWTGHVSRYGYGKINVGGVIKPAHRVSYEEFVGPIPEGTEPDHTCHDPRECSGGVTCPHRRCFNPEHIEPVTREKNASRERSCHRAINPAVMALGQQAAAKKKRERTHCVNGHEFTPDNTSMKAGYRRCKECHRESMRVTQPPSPAS